METQIKMKIPISLDRLTKILQDQKILTSNQIIYSVSTPTTLKSILVTCIENSNDQKSEIILPQNEEELDEILNKPIQELDISVRVLNFLKSKSLETLKDVISFSEGELRNERGFNIGSALELRKALRAFGLKLAEPKLKNL